MLCHFWLLHNSEVLFQLRKPFLILWRQFILICGYFLVVNKSVFCLSSRIWYHVGLISSSLLLFQATFDCLLRTYGFLTPEFWRETRFTKSPFQEHTDLLAKPTVKALLLEDPDRVTAWTWLISSSFSSFNYGNMLMVSCMKKVPYHLFSGWVVLLQRTIVLFYLLFFTNFEFWL